MNTSENSVDREEIWFQISDIGGYKDERDIRVEMDSRHVDDVAEIIIRTMNDRPDLARAIMKRIMICR